MSGRTLKRVPDKTKPTGVRVELRCGRCGAPLGRFDRFCLECGEVVEPELDREAGRHACER